MTGDLVAQWLASGALDLPLPGRGDTVQRWRRLKDLTRVDVVAGRLAEAHADAVAILAELDGPEPDSGQLWGVWAAEPPNAVLSATPGPDSVTVSGTKAWCSGAGICTHALVTADLTAGGHGLYAVDLSHPAVRPLASTWHNAGMAESDTRSVQFDDAPAIAVGKPGEYLSQADAITSQPPISRPRRLTRRTAGFSLPAVGIR